MGGKGSAPPAPDYSAQAASSLESSKIYAGLSTDQLNWAKQQYADQAPMTKAFMQNMMDTSSLSMDAQRQEMTNAQQAQDYYNKTYRPMEGAFAQEAQNYNTPQRAAQRSAAAQGDVSAAFTGQRNAALQTLEGFNIDPSQTRYGALDLGARIQQAAAQAGAGTQARNQTEATGLALQGEAVNIGRGYPGQVAQSYSTATSAGSGAAGQGGAGVNAGINTSTGYGGLMGSPTQWAGAANTATNTGINATNTGFQNQMAGFNANTAIAQNTASGIGGMIGTVVAAGAVAY